MLVCHESNKSIFPYFLQKLQSTPEVEEASQEVEVPRRPVTYHSPRDTDSPVTSTPVRKGRDTQGLKRSASDVNMEKRRSSLTNSYVKI